MCVRSARTQIPPPRSSWLHRELVRGLGARGRRTFLIKQGDSSAVCELDLSGLEDYVAVLSATTDNVALLDRIREDVGDEPKAWLAPFLDTVNARKDRSERSPT